MKFWVGLLIAILLLIACDKETSPLLVGKWQLKTVEKNGEVSAIDTVWYNFQSESIFAFQIYESQYDRYLLFEGLRTQKNNEISIELFNKWIVNHSDWSGVKRSFVIDRINKNHLILRSEEGYLYSFIKF